MVTTELSDLDILIAQDLFGLVQFSVSEHAFSSNLSHAYKIIDYYKSNGFIVSIQDQIDNDGSCVWTVSFIKNNLHVTGSNANLPLVIAKVGIALCNLLKDAVKKPTFQVHDTE